MSKATPVYAKAFTWVDVETTGLDPAVAEILEIAIVRVSPDGSEATFHSKVKPDHIETAHPKALEVNGYTEEAWADAPTQSEVWNKIVRLGLFEDCIIAGQNVRFDVGFIEKALHDHVEKAPRIGYHLYDTVTLAIEHLAPLGIESVSLTKDNGVCAFLGIPIEGAHTAMGDIRMTMEVDRKLRRANWLQRMWWKFRARRLRG